MKEEELRKWLLSLKGTLTKESDEEVIAWIMEALQSLRLTIDVDGLMRDATTDTDLKLSDILIIVAYGTPDLTQEVRRKKPFFHSSDYIEFYRNSDAEWKSFWQVQFYDHWWKEFLIPIE